jgi:hypothetical protein
MALSLCGKCGVNANGSEPAKSGTKSAALAHEAKELAPALSCTFSNRTLNTQTPSRVALDYILLL